MENVETVETLQTEKTAWTENLKKKKYDLLSD